MKYKLHSFRYAKEVLELPEFLHQKEELFKIIDSITEKDLIVSHNSIGVADINKTPMSLSVSLNKLFKKEFKDYGWTPEAEIFQNNEYNGDRWRLDFAKKDVSIEIAFNHSGSIAWNLIKPVLAGELNHVQKRIQTKVGVIITATEELKSNGAFDGAIGTFEQYIKYLKPMNNLLTIPILIIGIEKMETFYIVKHQLAPRKKIGIVEYL